MRQTSLFFQAAQAIRLTREQQHVGALAIILHDIWRQDTLSSHVDRSAETAREAMMAGVVSREGERLVIGEDVQELVIRLIQSHSFHSQRANVERVSAEWALTLKTIQYADIFSGAGAVGYLRAFSYSGHVFKSLLSRVRSFANDPVRYQRPLPDGLRRLLGSSHNYFHQWILSLMLKTNHSFLERQSV